MDGIAARFTIGADGARSTVARRLGLDVNPMLRTTPGRVAASRVLFGDGSFPDSRLGWRAAPA